MAGKKKSNKELNEEHDALVVKVKVLENLVKELASQLKEKGVEQEKYNTDRIDFLYKKVEEHDTQIKEVKDNSTKKKVSEEEFECSECDLKFKDKGLLKKHKKATHSFKPSKDKNCEHCGEKFAQNFELELHLKSHSEAEMYSCDQCDKTFVLKWRQKHHMKGHESKIFCHYFNNQKMCPFEELGCMFLHADSQKCKFQGNCSNKLCQFKHMDEDSETEDKIKKKKVKPNMERNKTETKVFKCEKCSTEFSEIDDLTSHVKNVHEAEESSDSFREFLKEQQTKMKDMTPTELFNLVDIIKNRDINPGS